MKTESTMYQTLIKNTGVESAEDGTTKGRFYALKKEMFSDRTVFDEYVKNMYYGCWHAYKSVQAGSDDTGRDDLKLANDYFNKCYQIVKKELEFDGSFALGMKYVNYWKDHGVFAGLGVDYENHGTTSKQAGRTKVRRFMEMDMSDILNGRERKSKTKTNKAIAGAIAKDQNANGTPEAK